MPYYAGALAAARILILSIATIGLLGGSVAFAQGPEDNIEVMVCPDASQSSFVLSEPQSDSVTNQPKVIVRGNVLFISQIDFFINDTYNHTIALAHTDVNFESVMSLPPGTHTLKFVATDSCSNTSHTESIVVTYEPAIQPSVGSEVDTRVDGQPSTPSDAVDAAPAKSVAQDIIDDVIVTPLTNLGRALDIISLPEGSASNALQNTGKSAFFIFGSFLTLLAAYIGLIGSVPSQLSFLSYSKRQLIGGLSVIGLTVLVLVFIL